MLELSDISLSFEKRSVLKHCSLQLAPGGHMALMGPSGCGKTTLLRLALGLQGSDQGTVFNSFSRPAAVFQEPRLLPWRTAAENVNAVLGDTPATLDKARACLARLSMEEAASFYPAELSGGMQQRVALARAIAFEPDFLVLDEPFHGLDQALIEQTVKLMIEALPQNAAILMATHSEHEARMLGCRVLCYHEGAFIE